MRKESRLGDQILAALAASADGLSMPELRAALGPVTGAQEHLNRRLRALDATHVIDRIRRGRETVYVLRGDRTVPLDTHGISATTRARILMRDHSRCQMCGRDVASDGVRLHIDHRVPREWGGMTDDDNLWCLCSECNQGKKAFFATIQDHAIRDALLDPRIHVRIGELLKARGIGNEVSKGDLQVVASTHEDWEKRLRELRVLGWRYRVVKRKILGRTRSSFVLEHSEPWPEDPAASIRAAERARR